MPAASPSPDAALQKFMIDPAHSTVLFKVSALGVGEVNGKFHSFEGTIEFDPEDLWTVGTHIEIDTDNPSLDDRLRSEELLWVEKHPSLSFESTEVRDLDVNAFELAGELTLRGVTRPITLDTTFLGLAHDQDEQRRAIFYAQTTFERSAFNVRGSRIAELGGLLASDQVQLMIDLQAVET